MPTSKLRNYSCSGSTSSNDSDMNSINWYIGNQCDKSPRNTSTKQLRSSVVDMDMDYQHDEYAKYRKEAQLPSIPVVMRHPHMVSSVKQYRTEDQQQQLAQPFISETFIPMTPNVTKPTRKRRRPPFSYSSLITQAILEAENERMTLRQIYDWIVEKYPSLYNATDIGWQNTIRHNLSLNRCFKKLPKSDLDSFTKGKGGYWTIDPNHMAKFKNGAFARGSSSTLRRKPGNSSTKTTTTNATTEYQPMENPSTPLPSVRYLHHQPSPPELTFHPSLGTLTQPTPSIISTQSSPLPKKPDRDTDTVPGLASTNSDALTIMNIHNILN